MGDLREQIVRVLASFPAASLGESIRFSSFKRRFFDQYKIKLNENDLRLNDQDFVFLENDSKLAGKTTIRWIEKEDNRVKRGLQPLLRYRSELVRQPQVTLKDWKALYKAIVRTISIKGAKLDDAPVDYPHAIFFCKLKPFFKVEMKAYDFDEHLWGFKKMRHLIDALIRWAASESIYTLHLHRSEKYNDYMLCCAGPEDETGTSESSSNKKSKTGSGENDVEEDPPDVKENMELRILVAELQKRLKIQVPEEIAELQREIRRLRIENAECKKRLGCVIPAFAYSQRFVPHDAAQSPMGPHQQIGPQQQMTPQTVPMNGGQATLPFLGQNGTINPADPQTPCPPAQWGPPPETYYVPEFFYNNAALMHQNMMSPQGVMSSGVMSPAVGAGGGPVMGSMSIVPTMSMSSQGMMSNASVISSDYSSSLSDQSTPMHPHSQYCSMAYNMPSLMTYDDRAMIPQGIVEAQKANFDVLG